ncbi:MAG: rbsB [Lachnospiraceae bacterium]|nr:rbsB [Lachnospiraceae bacterium]
MKTKKFLSIILVLAMVFSMTACSSSSSKDDKGTEQGPSGKSVSILTPYLSSVTTNQMVEYLKAGMEEAGMKVNVIDTKNDFAALASRIEDVVSAKTDAIVLVSADPSQVETQLQSAFDAGIPVFGCDSGFLEGMMANATSDNYAMGETITKYLFDELIGGEGDIIALTHRPHPGVVKRSEAFDTILAEYPNINLITEQHVEATGPIDNARTIVENLLLSNPEEGSIKAIWCAWDEPAIGATQALQDAGRDEVIVVGVDGNEQAVELVKGDTNLKATLAQNFEGMAEIVLDDMVKMFNGEEVEKGEKYAPATLITKEN